MLRLWERFWQAKDRLLLVSGLLIGGCAGTDEADASPNPVVRSLTLCDSQGRARLTLSLGDGDEPQINLIDAAGVVRTQVALSASSEPSILFKTGDGTPAVLIALRGTSASIVMNPDGGRNSMQFVASGDDGAELSMLDGTGTPRIRASVREDSPQLTILDGSSSRVFLGADPGEPGSYLIQLPSSDGHSAAGMGSSKNAPAYFMVSRTDEAWATLAVGLDNFPVLAFYDRANVSRLRLSLTAALNSQLDLCDTRGEASVVLRAPKEGFGLLNISEGNHPTAIFLGRRADGEILSGIIDAKNTTRAYQLLSPRNEAAFVIRGEDGLESWRSK